MLEIWASQMVGVAGFGEFLSSSGQLQAFHVLSCQPEIEGDLTGAVPSNFGARRQAEVGDALRFQVVG